MTKKLPTLYFFLSSTVYIQTLKQMYELNMIYYPIVPTKKPVTRISGTENFGYD